MVGGIVDQERQQAVGKRFPGHVLRVWEVHHEIDEQDGVRDIEKGLETSQLRASGGAIGVFAHLHTQRGA
jgi:hypothetical protein